MTVRRQPVRGEVCDGADFGCPPRVSAAATPTRRRRAAAGQQAQPSEDARRHDALRRPGVAPVCLADEGGDDRRSPRCTLAAGRPARDTGDGKLRPSSPRRRERGPTMAGAPSLAAAAYLPLSRTSLIGRERELGAARAFLLDEAVPLLTLTGPGGVGKTRLALAVADEVGGRLRRRGRLRRPGAARRPRPRPRRRRPRARRAARRATGRWPSGSPPTSAPRQLLLVLDNCEHLLAAAPDLVAGSWPPAPRCRCWPPAGRRCACGASSACRCRRWPCPMPAVCPPLPELAHGRGGRPLRPAGARGSTPPSR